MLLAVWSVLTPGSVSRPASQRNRARVRVHRHDMRHSCSSATAQRRRWSRYQHGALSGQRRQLRQLVRVGARVDACRTIADDFVCWVSNDPNVEGRCCAVRATGVTPGLCGSVNSTRRQLTGPRAAGEDPPTWAPIMAGRTMRACTVLHGGSVAGSVACMHVCTLQSTRFDKTPLRCLTHDIETCPPLSLYHKCAHCMQPTCPCHTHARRVCALRPMPVPTCPCMPSIELHAWALHTSPCS